MGLIIKGVVVSLWFIHAVIPVKQSKITAMLHVVTIAMAFPSITNDGSSVSRFSRYSSVGEV